MRVSYSTLVKAKRAGRATAVRVAPTGTVVTEYQVPLGNRHSLREAGVIGLPSWSDRSTQAETWAKVPRLSATCPRRVVAYDGGRSVAGTSLFDFFDDFLGTSLDAAKWSAVGTVTVSGGVATIASTDNNPDRLASVATFGSAIRVLARVKPTHVNSTGYAEQVAVRNAATFYGQFAMYCDQDAASNLKYQNYNGTATRDTLAGATAGAYLTQEITRTGSLARFRINHANTVTLVNNYSDVAANIYVSTVGNGASISVDWVAVGNYTTNEPLTGSAQPSATNRALSRPMRKADLIRACCT